MLVLVVLNSEGTVDGYAALVLSGQISNSDFILYIGSSNGLTLVRCGYFCGCSWYYCFSNTEKKTLEFLTS